MTRTVRELLGSALGLPEEERLELAAELLASVDGPADPGWDAAWLAELDARAAGTSEPTGREWTSVRTRILMRLQGG